MKPIGNIFGFDCVTCEHNRNCYGGNMGNQFRYCQKSIEKVQNLDKLQQENEILRKNAEKNDKVVDKVNWENQLLKKEIYQLKDNWNKLKEYITEANEDLYWTNNYDDILHVMQELEQGSDSNDSNR